MTDCQSKQMFKNGSASGIGLINKLKTHCIRGHALIHPNLDLYGLKHNIRKCRTCKNQKLIEHYNKNPEKIKNYNRENRTKRTILHQNYLKNHPDYVKNWNQNNNEKLKKYQKKYDDIHKKERREKDKRFRLTHPNYQHEWRKNNPRSSPSYSIELQESMNNVRKRDKNTCQWQNCKLTNRDAVIHVHHIFPRKEYPTLELIEQYMICYCAGHHGKWHEVRGDAVARLFKNILIKGVSD